MKMKFDFTKNRKVEKLDSVPENLRAFYEEVEGDGEGFQLKTDSVTTAAIAVISGLNGALTKARGDVETAKKANKVDLTILADYGDTPEAIHQSVTAKIKELTAQASGNEKDVQQRISVIKKEASEAMTKALAEKDNLLVAQKNTLHNYMLDTSIMNASSAFQGLNAKLVAPFAKQQMKIQEADGAAQVVIVDSNGEPRYSKQADRAGELMQADELLLEMSESAEFKQLFPSQQATTGGGTQTTHVPVGVRKTNNNKHQTPAEKISAGLTKKK
jgi:hypothetical protein